jgi:hypothetical protein
MSVHEQQNRRRPPRLGTVAARSLFPLATLVIVGGTSVWGPWVTLGLAYGWWRVVARIG